MPTNINISPVISSDISNTLSKAVSIKTFGNQNKSKETTIVGNQNKTAELNNQQNEITQKNIDAGLQRDKDIRKAQEDYNTRQLTEEQYNAKLEAINASYMAEIESLSIQQQKIQQDKENIANDPNDQLKNNQTAFKNNIKASKKKNQEVGNKSKRDLSRQANFNIIKSIAPVIALQLSNQFVVLISQRKKLEILVDQVNAYIDTKVKDQQTVIIATNLRNSAIALINSNIKKLEKIKKVIDTISKIISIMSIIITIIEKILNLPLLLPLKISVQPKLQKALKILSALNIILIMASTVLGNEIIRLNELINKLKQISLKLDGKILNVGDLNTLTNEFLPAGVGGDKNKYSSYKGFNFTIKEEQNPLFVVKGNKRHYAVAINNMGVEVIKSEYSFTLDPQDLIDQLKLVIDQQNLQG